MKANKLIIGATIHDEVIQNIAEKLKAYYIFPDIAEKISFHLQRHLDNGDYSNITDGEFFSKVLTEHIQEVNQDKHLRVMWHQEPSAKSEVPMHLDKEWMERHSQQIKLDNYGFYKVERLPGNIGYFDIHAFGDASSGGETAVAAMTFLSNTNELIFDLRKCHGGDPATVALICSYLFEEEHIHLNTFYWRENAAIQQYWTQPYIPGKRLSKQPIYILTSKDTASGGEEFAYNLKTRQRAILIGETTNGSGNIGTFYRLNSHFDIFISTGRLINPITETNWEGIGVTPDIPASQDQAFKIAYSKALKSVIESISREKSSLFNLLKEEAQAALKEME